MKKILFGLILTIVMFNVGWADFQGIKKSTENVYFFLNPPLDSAYGIERKPDSAHVFTYADGDMKYGVTNATYPFTAAGIDTIKHLGDTTYQFFDAIADIDGAGGNFLLGIAVGLYYDKIPTWTYASVQVVSDSLENFLDASMDSSSSAALSGAKALDSLADVLDSLEQYDGWVAKEATVDKVIDSLADVLDSLETQSVWIQDSLYAVLDTLQLWDTRIDSIEAALADASIGDKVWADGTPANRAEINDILDTLQNQDNWVATSSNQTLIIDTVNGIIDTLNNFPSRVDLIWDEDTTGHKTDPNMGFWITQSVAGDISDADMIAIVDTLMTRNVPDDTTAGAGDDMNVADLLFRAGDTVNWLGSGEIVIADTNASGETISTFAAATDSVIVDVSTANTAAGLNTQIAATVLALTSVSGTVEDSASNSTTRVQTSLGEATDDHYNGMMIVFHTTGNEANQARRITDYDGTAGWVVWTPAVTGTPASGDIFTIMPWASVSATATLPDSILGDVSDIANRKVAVAVADTNASGETIAVMPGDWTVDDTTAYQGAAAGLTATEIFDSIRAFPISDTVTGKYFSQLIRQLDLVWDSINAYDNWLASEVTALKSLDSLAHVLDSLELYDTRWDSVLAVIADGTFGRKVWSKTDTAHVDSSDMGVWITNNISSGASGTRTMTFVTLDTGAAGGGVNDTLSNIMLEVIDKSGNTYYQGRLPSGKIPVLCNDNDTFLVYAKALPAYNFLGEGGAGTEIGYDSIFIVNGDTTIDVQGYAISVTAPSSSALIRLYAFPRDINGDMVTGARLIVQLQGNNIEDARTGTPLLDYEQYGTTTSAGDSGFTYIDVINTRLLLKQGRSDTLTAATVKYKVGIDYGNTIDWKWNDTTPDSTTHRITRY